MRIFIAQTLDGFIAGEDDSLHHLVPFQHNDYGYDAMLAEVDTVVVGRRTFDRIFPQYGWPYPPRLNGVVLTRRPLPAELPPNVTGHHDPREIAALAPEAFVDGGARTIAAFIELGVVRRATIFTLPVHIGRGVRLFPERAPCAGRWDLVASRAYACGTIAAEYRIPTRDASGPSSAA